MGGGEEEGVIVGRKSVFYYQHALALKQRIRLYGCSFLKDVLASKMCEKSSL